MKPYSLTTQYKSWTKETLISILDELGNTDYQKSHNKSELVNELVEYYNVEMVLNASNIDALRRLFNVVGTEEIYRVVDVDGGTTPNPSHLNAKDLRNILIQFQRNMMIDAYALYQSDTTSKENLSLLISISLDTWTEEERESMNEIIGLTDDSE